ncbi:MAG: hypothetical protein R3F47_18640 [Gammaproteobacteria bacterium]
MQLITNLNDPRFVRYFSRRRNRWKFPPPAAPADPAIPDHRVWRRRRLIVVRDVTRLHNLEQMRKDFVVNVHELRTP